jgi:ATP-dependent Clp endopeptidase proteolytic subunit ClpP
VQENEEVTLRIDGDIVDDDDAWLYEWFEMQCASPNAFRTELEQHKGKNINLWIDSYGGSVFAAVGIYNALMEHKNTGGKITSIVDGKAMSAAVMLFLAGDTRLMTPASVLMIHNPLTGASGYASDLRKVANTLDIIKDNIINAYELATGLSREKLSQLMDEETLMGPKVAVDNSFATGVKYLDTATEQNNNVLNFSFNRLAIQNAANDSFKAFFELAKSANQENLKSVANNKKNEEVNQEMEIKNSADLKTQLPEIHEDIYNSGVKAGKNEGVATERERLKAFDALNGKVDADFLATEKYKDGATAENVLFMAMQEGKMINSAYVAQAATDAANANAVPGATPPVKDVDEVKGVLAAVQNVAKNVFGKGGK